MIEFHALYDDAKMPVRATKHSAGYDLFYYGKQRIRLSKLERRLLMTGVTLEMDRTVNLYGAVCTRSGKAIKQGLIVANAPGIVDADYYPNEIGVILINLGEESVFIEPGDAIAQLVICEYFMAENEILVEKEREGGFGHTDAG